MVAQGSPGRARSATPCSGAAHRWRASTTRADRASAPDRRLPVEVGSGSFDLGEDQIDHAVDDRLLVRHVVVDRHRLHVERVGERRIVRSSMPISSASASAPASTRSALSRGRFAELLRNVLTCVLLDFLLPIVLSTGRVVNRTVQSTNTDSEHGGAQSHVHHHRPDRRASDHQPNERRARPTSTSTAMSAVVQRRYGPPTRSPSSRFRCPDVGETEVLIDVVAAGLDRGVVT